MAPFGGKIAVIEISGTIGRRTRPETHLPLLERVRDSKRLHALVLAIDSPGGAAPASEELYLGVAKVAASKPVVACIRGMGTSGALYVASGAHKVIAVRNAMVGSIGVIFAQPIAEQLFQKIGLSFSVRKTGPHKDMFGPWRAPTEDENKKLDDLMGEVFERFIEVVAQGRKMSPDAVRKLATGEVFTAQRAKELGLVDELGDMEDALNAAAKMAGIRKQVTYLRPKRRMFSLFRGGLGEDLAAAFMEEVEAGMMGRLRM